MKPASACVIALSLFITCLALPPAKNALAGSSGSIQALPDSNGIRVVAREVELYFNKTNGGEITEYFDLVLDPSRSRNLANIRWSPWENLLPLFTSLFYRAPEYALVMSTGGDPDAKLSMIGNTSEYVILQSSSRIMSKSGSILKDINGNAVYVNSTWIVRDTGLISVQRAFLAPNPTNLSTGWRWYPFYLTRTATTAYSLTFHMFNTTYTHSAIVNPKIYKDSFSMFQPIPNDTRHVFGVAFPFSNASVGGDGTHNILIAYKYDEMIEADQWKSDNCYSTRSNITEGGAVYEFSQPTNISTHTYHMLVNFTHQAVDGEALQSFADYYAQDPSIAVPIECSTATSKDLYKPGDYYAFHALGISHYRLTRLIGRLTVTSSSNKVMYKQQYGPANTAAGQTFNLTLLTGTVAPLPDTYTVLFEILSQSGIALSSSSKTIIVATP